MLAWPIFDTIRPSKDTGRVAGPQHGLDIRNDVGAMMERGSVPLDKDNVIRCVLHMEKGADCALAGYNIIRNAESDRSVELRRLGDIWNSDLVVIEPPRGGSAVDLDVHIAPRPLRHGRHRFEGGPDRIDRL